MDPSSISMATLVQMDFFAILMWNWNGYVSLRNWKFRSDESSIRKACPKVYGCRGVWCGSSISHCHIFICANMRPLPSTNIKLGVFSKYKVSKVSAIF
uniref:Uncharacterized protein n=1 Tax=Daphnia magna TaxID=35525 RepID=A0ABQ9Z1E1_9CRUS|nr:hypothetical protein OUZ56_011775 [Daphnia magna]